MNGDRWRRRREGWMELVEEEEEEEEDEEDGEEVG